MPRYYYTHEIAEIYLRLADLHSDKFEDHKLEKRNIRNSIDFLKTELSKSN